MNASTTTATTAANYDLQTVETLTKARVMLGLKSRKGDYNAVAYVKATGKGKRLEIVRPDGIALDGARSSGKNEGGYYLIREADFWSQGSMRLYCECPAQRFDAGYGRPCKHVRKLLAEAPALMEGGAVSNGGVTVLWPEAIARALKIQWAVNRIPEATIPHREPVRVSTSSLSMAPAAVISDEDAIVF